MTDREYVCGFCPSTFYTVQGAVNHIEKTHHKTRTADASTPSRVENTGIRYNEGKSPFHLLPWDALRELADHYGRGAGKYAPRNWENGLPASFYFDSLQRHLCDWFQNREERDKEGFRHLTAVAWNAIGLLVQELRGMTEFDDRPLLPGSRSGDNVGPRLSSPGFPEQEWDKFGGYVGGEEEGSVRISGLLSGGTDIGSSD